MKKAMIDFLLVALSAVLLVIVFPGYDINYLVWVALVPLILLISRSGPVEAFLSSLLAGFLFFCGLLWWALSMKEYHALNFVIQNIATACYYGVFGLCAYYFQKKIPKWNVLTFPAVWVILEYLRSNLGFLSWPWGILGYSQYTVLPVARVAAYTGVYGISFLIVTVNTVMAEIIFFYLSPAKRKDFRGVPLLSSRKISIGILSGAVIFLSSSLLYGVPIVEENKNAHRLKVALVQGGVYLGDRLDSPSQYISNIFPEYKRLTLNAADKGLRPHLIVWPESSAPGIIPYNQGLVLLISELANRVGSFLLIGTSGYDKFDEEQRETGRLANSAFLFSPQNKILGRYDKIRLLPFNEYLPLRGYVTWPSWLASPDMKDAEPGKKMTIFSMGNYRFGVQICWENLFPDLFRRIAAKGVDFMVSMTNEVFTNVPAAHYQMLAMNVFRSIENNVSIVRIASTGVSAIIEPTGRIAARIQDQHGNDINVKDYVVGEIPISDSRTLYNRYGDWFVYVLLIMLTGFIVFIVRKQLRNRRYFGIDR
jgi:apolipoprotein N-acyltransferase